ncbi:Sodium/calcium exchanger 1 [Symbiodinium microadriaticum]|uniref:Sodium/calcium exchanger 1 n=1 Tax=Symbiodinium microadriaticum TaxID=2951 RepID=A0A1Q9DY49_SYMMI|nr:Sodium/calcium exchanger 1 [Symbiodinium microadriaticum]CAE7209344.1 Slc8a1 [Symbiodinium microadriaticum]CAE7267940.1 Slc8a1 [Symbiodinium sp. KB8]
MALSYNAGVLSRRDAWVPLVNQPVVAPVVAAPRIAAPPPSQPPRSRGNDVVQFLSRTFYYTEKENALIRVARVGSLYGQCSVNWRTEDGSAQQGQKYHGGGGTLVFGPGESLRSFEVEIIDDDFFDSNLEFEVVLEDARNCVIEPASARSTIMIMDDDLFPANELEEELKKEDEAGLYKIGWTVLWSFMRFSYGHVREIRWKTNVVLLLSMLGNAYYLGTIFIRVYLVDTVLNPRDEESSSRLLIPGDRNGTAVALALAWILPNFVLLASDYFEMAVLEMGFNIRYYLRVNLFRKYLYYTQQSRSRVPIQDLKISMMDDIPELVSEGYLIVFELWAMLGKIACIAFFMLRKHPSSALPLFAYPVILAIYLRCTYHRRLDLMAKEGEGQSDTTGVVMELNTSRRLLSLYDGNSVAVRNFEEILHHQRSLTMDLKRFQFWNAQVIPWITLLAIGSYMASSPKVVLSGGTSLGSFLATVNVYKDLGDRFSTILKGFTALSKSISPLCGITLQLNYETEVPAKKEVFQRRESFTLDWLTQHAPSGASLDDIPIVFMDATIVHSPSMKRKAFSAEAPQGSIIQVAGHHDVGKMTLLQLISGHLSPSTGEVVISPHLEILYVAHEPLFIQNAGLFCNLHMISTVDEMGGVNIERGLRILRRLQLDKPWIKEMYESEAAALQEVVEASPTSDDGMFGCLAEEEKGEDEEADEDSDAWFDRLSTSERVRFQLARAFVANPHVLAINRPVQDLDDDMRQAVLSCMKEFTQNRGLEVDDGLDIQQRRPRTIIFTTADSVQIDMVDTIWRLSADSGVVVERPPKAFAMQAGASGLATPATSITPRHPCRSMPAVISPRQQSDVAMSARIMPATMISPRQQPTVVPPRMISPGEQPGLGSQRPQFFP